MYYNSNNDIHRPDGPAVIWRNTSIRWCWHLNNREHRYYGTTDNFAGYWVIHGEVIKFDR